MPSAAPGRNTVLDVVPPSLPSRVRGISMAGFRDRGPGPFVMRTIPHPAVTLALDLSQGTFVVDGVTGAHRGSIVVGVGSSDLWVRGRDIEAVQVRLTPTVAGSVLGASPAELGCAVIALDDLWGRDAARVQDQLLQARSWEHRFALVDDLLVRRSEAGRAVPPEVARAWSRIARSGGRVRIEAVAAEIGWSRKRLWSRFRSHIGLTPHRAARLVRFHHAVHRLAAGRRPAAVAAESGYFDQSHLHRDVRAFTGITPAAVAGEAFLAVDDIAWPGHAPPVTPGGRR